MRSRLRRTSTLILVGICGIGLYSEAISSSPALCDLLYRRGTPWRALTVLPADYLSQGRGALLALGSLLLIVAIQHTKHRPRLGTLHCSITMLALLSLAASSHVFSIPRDSALSTHAAAGSPQPPHIILLWLDGLRSESINARQMPNLYALQSRSTHFANAWTSIPDSTGSLVSALTGSKPSAHGFRGTPLPRENTACASVTTIAHRLNANQYQSFWYGTAKPPLLTQSLGFEQEQIFPNSAELVDTLYHSLRESQSPTFSVVQLSHTKFPFVADTFIPQATSYRGKYRFSAEGFSSPSSASDSEQLVRLYESAVTNLDRTFGSLFSLFSSPSRPLVVFVASPYATQFASGVEITPHGVSPDNTRIAFFVYDSTTPVQKKRVEVVQDIDLCSMITEVTAVDSPCEIDFGVRLAGTIASPLPPKKTTSKTNLRTIEDSSTTDIAWKQRALLLENRSVWVKPDRFGVSWVLLDDNLVERDSHRASPLYSTPEEAELLRPIFESDPSLSWQWGHVVSTPPVSSWPEKNSSPENPTTTGQSPADVPPDPLSGEITTPLIVIHQSANCSLSKHSQHPVHAEHSTEVSNALVSSVHPTTSFFSSLFSRPAALLGISLDSTKVPDPDYFYDVAPRPWPLVAKEHGFHVTLLTNSQLLKRQQEYGVLGFEQRVQLGVTDSANDIVSKALAAFTASITSTDRSTSDSSQKLVLFISINQTDESLAVELQRRFSQPAYSNAPEHPPFSPTIITWQDSTSCNNPHDPITARARAKLAISSSKLPANYSRSWASLSLSELDLAPTILALLKISPDPGYSGVNLLAHSPDERRIRWVEGPTSRAVVQQGQVLVEHDLDDHESDDKSRWQLEQYSLADPKKKTTPVNPQLVEALTQYACQSPSERHQRSAALASSRCVYQEQRAARTLTLTLSSGPNAHSHDITLWLEHPPGQISSKLDLLTSDLPQEAIQRIAPDELRLFLDTSPQSTMTVILRVTPSSAAIRWSLRRDEAVLPNELVFAGPLGLWAPFLATGITTPAERQFAQGTHIKWLDAARDEGVFILTGPTRF